MQSDQLAGHQFAVDEQSYDALFQSEKKRSSLVSSPVSCDIQERFWFKILNQNLSFADKISLVKQPASLSKPVKQSKTV